ncbi:MAG: hypothetical protein R3E93_00280 [Thiothrix sp.]
MGNRKTARQHTPNTCPDYRRLSSVNHFRTTSLSTFIIRATNGALDIFLLIELLDAEQFWHAASNTR